ncbi:MAG: type II secretion system protein [Candidatus Pacebacteria bacterium]|nr:type II secretion system protein [Candidatus Paceibacterota bacterium]MBP9840758.1 type II secretion system protein [Candidatus Paceibacterota bacterium]
MKKQIRGFTLIELLVVIAIIGLLSSVVLASLGQARVSARDAKREQGLIQLRNALEIYRTANGAYPPSCNGHAAWGGDNWGSPTCPTNYIVGLAPTYIGALPQRAGTSDTYIYRTDASGANYKLLMSGIEVYNSADSLADPGTGGTPPNCTNVPGRSNAYAVHTAGGKCF